MTSQYRIDASPEWVRSFLIAGADADDVRLDGAVVEVRQRDRLIDLIVRNTITPAGDGTVLDVDAQLRLLGLGRIIGTLFAGRVRRTLVRSLDGLPAAIERSLLEEEDGELGDDGGATEPQVPAEGPAVVPPSETPPGG